MKLFKLHSTRTRLTREEGGRNFLFFYLSRATFVYARFPLKLSLQGGDFGNAFGSECKGCISVQVPSSSALS